MTKKKKPDTITTTELTEESIVAKKELEPKILRFFSLGFGEDGRSGVYTLEVDVANKLVMSLDFKAEDTRSAAVERFKIGAAGLFKGV